MPKALSYLRGAVLAKSRNTDYARFQHAMPRDSRIICGIALIDSRLAFNALGNLHQGWWETMFEKPKKQRVYLLSAIKIYGKYHGNYDTPCLHKIIGV